MVHGTFFGFPFQDFKKLICQMAILLEKRLTKAPLKMPSNSNERKHEET
jgi:hypothetical protein